MSMIFIGADHAGYSLKEKIKERYETVDVMPMYDERDDYPDVAKKLGLQVVQKKTKGVLICGSGIGMSIAANKVRGVRAALCHNPLEAVLARQDNDANVLCLSGRMTSRDTAFAVIDAFLATSFAGNKAGGSRHKRRVKKIALLES